MGEKSRRKFSFFLYQLCAACFDCFKLITQTHYLFLKRGRDTTLPSGTIWCLRLQLDPHCHVLERERETRNESTLLVQHGGSTENNDRKVGPQEREYTRFRYQPSPGCTSCLSYVSFHQRSVDL